MFLVPTDSARNDTYLSVHNTIYNSNHKINKCMYALTTNNSLKLWNLMTMILHIYILTYNDRDVTHLHIKWGVAVGPNVIGAGTRHLPPSRIHAPVTNPR